MLAAAACYRASHEYCSNSKAIPQADSSLHALTADKMSMASYYAPKLACAALCEPLIEARRRHSPHARAAASRNPAECMAAHAAHIATDIAANTAGGATGAAALADIAAASHTRIAA